MKPFSTLTEFINWQEHNCDKCKIYENESTEIENAGCKLAFSLDLASVSDGEIADDIAEQIGVNKKGCIASKCEFKDSLRAKRLEKQKEPELFEV